MISLSNSVSAIVKANADGTLLDSNQYGFLDSNLPGSAYIYISTEVLQQLYGSMNLILRAYMNYME